MKKFIHTQRFTPKGYSDEVEARIQQYKKEGVRLPQRHLLRTAEQLAGIRESAKINTALLDYVAANIREGMTTADASPPTTTPSPPPSSTKDSPRAYASASTTLSATASPTRGNT